MAEYSDFKRSILAYVNSMLRRNAINGFQVFDFDTHAVTKELPQSDLVGIGEYSTTNMKDMHHITCMIMVCTMSDDAELGRLTPVIDALYHELKPGASGEMLPVLDAQGLKRGYLTVMDDVMVTAVGATKTRPIQALALSFGAGYLKLPTE